MLQALRSLLPAFIAGAVGASLTPAVLAVPVGLCLASSVVVLSRLVDPRLAPSPAWAAAGLMIGWIHGTTERPPPVPVTPGLSHVRFTATGRPAAVFDELRTRGEDAFTGPVVAVGDVPSTAEIAWLEMRGGEPVASFADRERRHPPLQRFRRRLAATLGDRLSPDAAALARALLLGESLPPGLRTRVRRAGALHFFAVSGLHLGLFAATLLSLRGGRGGLATTLPILAILAGYAALTGARPPVVRAWCAVAAAMLARRRTRSFCAGWALIVIAALTIAGQPSGIRDPGFALSFSAMAGILFLAVPLSTPPRDDRLARFLARKTSPSVRFLRGGVVTSWAALVCTAPITAGVFGSIGAVSLVSSVVLLPFIASMMVASTVALVLPDAGGPAELVTWLLLQLVRGLGEVPGGFVQRGDVPLPVCIAAAAAPVIAMLVGRRRSRLVIGSMGVVLLLAWPCPPREEVRVLSGATARVVVGRGDTRRRVDVPRGGFVVVDRTLVLDGVRPGVGLARMRRGGIDRVVVFGERTRLADAAVRLPLERGLELIELWRVGRWRRDTRR